ncbi:MAG: hypothetical protein JWM97_2821 [Phycisphaerales bacterium]|nr:hypothetical protein [Phycisphaerales bacterium]
MPVRNRLQPVIGSVLLVVWLCGGNCLADSPKPTTRPANPPDEQIQRVLDTYRKAVEAANDQYGRSIEAARKQRDMAVGTADRATAQALSDLGQRLANTDPAKSAEVYKILGTIDPAIGAATTQPGSPAAAEAGVEKVQYAKTTKFKVVPAWQAYGKVSKGDVIDIEATGTWSYNTGKSHGPDGLEGKGILQAKVGAEGLVINVGNGSTLTVVEDGTLQMGMYLDHPPGWYNPSGFMSVTLKLRKPPKGPIAKH